MVIGNRIVHNQNAEGYDGGGLLLWAVENTVIESNVIGENGTTGQGGAIAAYNTDAMIIAQNLFYGNFAAYGAGAIAILAPEESQGPFFGLIQNNTFVGNTISEANQQGSRSASQIYLEGNLGQYEFTDNIVLGADANPAFVCGTTYNYLSATPLVIDHNDIYNSEGPAYGGACPDQTGQYGNISADPLFKNATGNDYHLLRGSPAIDAGNNSALQLLANLGYPLSGDLEGNPRVQDATGKGYPVIDMGAYEYAGTHTASPTTMVLNPSAYNVSGGQSFTLTANLYSPLGTPTGSATFFEDGNQIGTAAIDNTGAAVITLGLGLAPGTHAFLATYPGEGSFTPCESVKIYVLVNAYGVTLTLNSNPNPSLVGQSVTFQVNISAQNGIPPGNITVTDLSTNTALATLTPDASGNASFATSTLALGTHQIQASYDGNTTYLAASAYVLQVVNNGIATTIVLTSSLNPSPAGAAVTFTAAVSSTNGVPTGWVTFLDGTKTLATVDLQNGSAAYTTSSLTVGSHTITAGYVPVLGNWLPGSTNIIQLVNGKPTTTTMSAAPNPAYALQAVTLSGQVTAGGGTPSGSVIFFDGGAKVGSANLSTGGMVTVTVNFASAAPNPHMLTASYSGDAQFNPSTSAAYPEAILLNPTTTVLVSMTPNPVGAYLSTTLQAKVSSSTSAGNVPAGSITFSASGTILGTAALQGGVATAAVNAGPAGAYPVTAIYNGNQAFAGSASASATLTVIPEPSTVTLISSLNPSILGSAVTFTAKAASQGTGIPLTGSFTFFDGSTQMGQSVQAANGSATFSTNSLALGTHGITAVYSGNASVRGSTSPILSQTVVAYTGDFTLSAKPDAADVYTGEAAKFTLVAAPENGFDLPLTTSCSGLPPNTTWAFTPASLAGGQHQSTLVLKTSAPAQATSARGISGGVGVFAAIFGLLYIPRRFRRAFWISSVLLAILATCSGCSDSKSLTGGTPPGTYQITVTAQTSTSGPQLSHSITIHLKVKSLF